LLLLDEPLSGLDVTTRNEVIAALKQWTAEWKIPVLSVTHALGEAFQLAGVVIRIADGRVVQQGAAVVGLAEERAHLMKQLGG